MQNDVHFSFQNSELKKRVAEGWDGNKKAEV